MTIKYEEIIKARMIISAGDGDYTVQFFRELQRGKTYEFNPMSDAVGQYETYRTGRIKVHFTPVSLIFQDDLNRLRDYYMKIEQARNLYIELKTNPQYWYALDRASLLAKYK